LVLMIVVVPSLSILVPASVLARPIELMPNQTNRVRWFSGINQVRPPMKRLVCGLAKRGELCLLLFQGLSPPSSAPSPHFPFSQAAAHRIVASRRPGTWHHITLFSMTVVENSIMIANCVCRHFSVPGLLCTRDTTRIRRRATPYFAPCSARSPYYLVTWVTNLNAQSPGRQSLTR
jgi:hypothetical protein